MPGASWVFAPGCRGRDPATRAPPTLESVCGWSSCGHCRLPVSVCRKSRESSQESLEQPSLRGMWGEAQAEPGGADGTKAPRQESEQVPDTAESGCWPESPQPQLAGPWHRGGRALLGAWAEGPASPLNQRPFHRARSVTQRGLWLSGALPGCLLLTCSRDPSHAFFSGRASCGDWNPPGPHQDPAELLPPWGCPLQAAAWREGGSTWSQTILPCCYHGGSQALS